jgi:hypothetical protein
MADETTGGTAVAETTTDAATTATDAAATTAAGDTTAVESTAASTETTGAAKGDTPAALTLKAPADSPLTTADLERIAADATARGLSPEDAQLEVVTAHANAVRDAAIAAHDPGGAEWVKAQDEWKAAALADAEIGGTPEKLAASVALGKQALARFATPEFQQELYTSGMASNPEMVRVFARIGRAMSDGEIRLPSAPPATEARAADVLYGGTTT